MPETVRILETGGTIGGSSVAATEGAQASVLEVLKRLPAIQLEMIPNRIRADSSTHSRDDMLALARIACESAQTKGTAVFYGTDTGILFAGANATVGVETIRHPVTEVSSLRDAEERNPDAFTNALAGVVYAAVGKLSGVLVVRENGKIITARHDAHGVNVDWHARGVDETQTHIAHVHLDQLVDSNYFPLDALARPTKPNPDGGDPLVVRKDATKLKVYRGAVSYKELERDGTLDFADQLWIGSRGMPPKVRLGFSKDTDTRLRLAIDGEVESAGHFPVDEGYASRIANSIARLVDEERVREGYTDPGEGKSCTTIYGKRFVGRAIPFLALAEKVRRRRSKKSDANAEWDKGLQKLLEDQMGVGYYLAQQITAFWERHSDVLNDRIDTGGITSHKVGTTDPRFLLETYRNHLPSGIILEGTGSGGIRLGDNPDSYQPLLEYCREMQIPVVITAGSKGEPTGFKYEPALKALNEDLAFFSGTMDADLMLWRMALLNAGPHRAFLSGLVDAVEVDDTIRAAMSRNIQRQLLSGNHYRAKDPREEISDRQLVEKTWGIETRADLLSTVTGPKAILAAYMHEVDRRGMPISERIGRVLETSYA